MKTVFRVWVMAALAAGIVPAAHAQFYVNPANFTLVSQTQLGNLGYTRYRGFGARALGMGGAYVALADDLTAASWNPAGLGQILEPALSFGLASSTLDAEQALAIDGDWTLGASAYRQRQTQGFSFSGDDSELHLDYVAGSYPIDLSGDWTLAVSGSYFRSLVFDQDFSAQLGGGEVLFSRVEGEDILSLQRFGIARAAAEQHRSGYLDAYTVAAALNWRDTVYVGVAVARMDGSLSGTDVFEESGEYADLDPVTREQRRVLESNLTAKAKTTIEDLSMSGVSWSLGVLAKLGGGWRIGAVYKPAYSLDVDGAMTRSVDVTGDVIAGSSYAVEYTFSGANVDYPSSLSLGLAWDPTLRWTLALDWSRTSWADSVLEGTYTRQEASGTVRLAFPSLMVLTSENGATSGYEQFDASVWRFGAEYRLSAGATSVLPLRFGVFKENGYRNYPGVGDGIEITGVTAGVGLLGEHWKLDAAVVYESADQGLGGREWREPRISLVAPGTGTTTTAGYRYGSGSSGSQSSVRFLLNVAYLF